MKMPLAVKATVLLLCAALLAPAAASADSPYRGYLYDNNNNTPVSINGYLYLDSIDGFGLESGPLKGPEDIFVAPDDTLYIVESGNNRVIRIDASGALLGVYGDAEGAGALNGPKGVFVQPDGEVYVADTLNRRIAIYAADGRFERELGTPQSPLLGAAFVYSPSKLIVDKRGYLFVVSDGASQGLLQIRPDGQFAGFFGANHVGFDWTRVLVRLIATREQRAQLASVRPPEFSNLFEDNEGFIYTSSLGVSFNHIKRLSAVGVDTLNRDNEYIYGDFFMPLRNNEFLVEAFVDVSVSAQGLITALDQTTGKLFQYDKLGNLLFIFGGIGAQNGLFLTPSSVAETSDGTLYVADRTRNRIDRFYTTPFAQKVHEASYYYVEGLYDEASVPWHEVLEMNSNYDLAYYAIGKALFRQQKYEQSMAYMKLARSQSGYSDALHEYRKVYIRENFGVLMTSLIALLIAARLLAAAVRRRWFGRLLTLRARRRKEA